MKKLFVHERTSEDVNLNIFPLFVSFTQKSNEMHFTINEL